MTEYTQAEAEAARTKLAAYDAKIAEAARAAREQHLEPIKSLVTGDAYDFVVAQLEAIGDHYDIVLDDDNRYGVDANLMSTIAALRQVMVSAKTVAESAY